MAGPVTPILDTFNRADENPAAGWTSVFNNVKVVSNQALGNNAAGAVAYITTPASTNCEAYATVAIKPAATATLTVAIRMKDTGAIATLDAYIANLINNVGTDAIRIQRTDNAVNTTLVSSSTEFAVGDKVVIKASGNDLELHYYNGSIWSVLLTTTDSTYPNVGPIGLGYSDGVGAMDDFGGGSLPLIYADPLDGLGASMRGGALE